MTKRILVTGASGFVGHHFVEHVLKNTDWEIIAACRVGQAGDMHRLLLDVEVMKDPEFAKRVKFVYHDFTCPVPSYTASRIGVVDYVMHFAANSHVDRSISEPVKFVYDNVVGTAHLLEWARLGGLKPDGLLINFGTDEVFGPAPDDYNFKETDRWRPSNPYSASKAGQLALGYAYYVTFKLPVVTTFTMNIFGERQNTEKLVPKAMRYIKEGKPFPIHCKLEADGSVSEIGLRHWLHARNAADALLTIFQKGKAGEFYNVVGFDELDNKQVVEAVAEAMGMPVMFEYVDFHKTRPGHDRRYALDGSKIKTELGWEPKVSFREGIKKVVSWTLAHPEWFGQETQK